MLTKSCKSRLIINSLYSLSNGNSHSFCTVSTNMCYYDVLNVRSTATHAEIKSAYYEKVKKFHPDTNTEKGAEEKFKIIAKAYEILKDPNSRQAYDSTKYERAAGTNQSKSQSSYQHNANYYSSYSAEQTRRRYSYGDAWQGYNSSEKHEERTQKSYSQQTQDHSSELKGLLIKVGVVFAVFGLLTMWKSQKKEVSKTQINREVKMEQEQSKLTMQELQEEMKRKNFRMEHTTVQVYVPPESIEAKKAYKKEKKVTGLESFMEKRNFKLEKSDGY